MTGTAALGLHLVGADTAGSLGPMTAAVVAMAAGGKVSPSGDVAVFGLTGAGAKGASRDGGENHWTGIAMLVSVRHLVTGS